MTDILRIPEVAGLDHTGGTVRIPPEQNVPLTPRVRRLIDSPEFRRLARVSQLGLVARVYPGATHSRFEHSLGVYRLALLFLKHFSYDRRFAEVISPAAAERLIVAALIHDIGHWPYCHPIEDLKLAGVPDHEDRARSILLANRLGERIAQDWQTTPEAVTDLLSGGKNSVEDRVLASLMSGPIDIDKMDYLARDSLHAGVPYGRHFDQGRLIGSLCLNDAGDRLAITTKGKTAAELMVFARYVMFSEVYWHHSVRAATAMLGRLVAWYAARHRLADLFDLGDAEFDAQLLSAASGEAIEPLAQGLLGLERDLYKRVAQYSLFEDRELFDRLKRRPYGWLMQLSQHTAERLASRLGHGVLSHEILFDAPPTSLEVQFRVEVCSPTGGASRWLEELSPVVRSLAREQFDDYVKQVRIFAPRELAGRLRELPDMADLVHRAIDDTENALATEAPGR